MMLWNDDILKAEFEGYYKKATECNDSTQLVAIMYAMIEALQKDNHAYEAEVHPSHMGIHPDRSGKKMVGQSMQKKRKQ